VDVVGHGLHSGGEAVTVGLYSALVVALEIGPSIWKRKNFLKKLQEVKSQLACNLEFLNIAQRSRGVANRQSQGNDIQPSSSQC
jgi:hypothetical protein